jgi:autotransporter translocation and assembly factor TamB
MKLSKWFRRTLVVLALVAAGAGGLYLFLQSGPGRDTVAGLIESLAASDNLKITIDGLEGTLPGGPRAKSHHRRCRRPLAGAARRGPELSPASYRRHCRR